MSRAGHERKGAEPASTSERRAFVLGLHAVHCDLTATPIQLAAHPLSSVNSVRDLCAMECLCE